MKLLRKSGGSHFFDSLRRFRSRGNAAQRVQKTSVEQNCLRRDRGARTFAPLCGAKVTAHGVFFLASAKTRSMVSFRRLQSSWYWGV